MTGRFLRILLALAAAWAGCASHGAAVDRDARHAALLTITTEEIKDLVGTLADDTFEGREAGSRGNRAAGIYITERLKKSGVAPGGPKGSYYQGFGSYHNILGLIEGSDPALRGQVIVASAHYDHVGYGTARNSYGPVGLIHNGADDNASGVAGLLEIAEAVSRLAEKPKRSILFAFWDGEEKGLLGSQHWVESPTLPLGDVVCMLNSDMIGRLRDSKLHVYGVRTCRGLRQRISRQNDLPQLRLDFTWEMKADSDHYTFYVHDIPIVMAHTGMHGDYHRPSDDADKVDNEGVKRVAQLLFGVLVDLADAPTLEGFRGQCRGESKFGQQAVESPLPPALGRLGLRWDEQQAAQGTILVTATTPGTAADKGGLRGGDKILSFSGHEVHSAAEFRRVVLSAENPVTVTIERPGENEPRTLTLELAGPPVRLGISWRSDDAEPGCVIVSRVTPGSPADDAGLRVNDRVYRVGGQEFATGEEFRQLAIGQAGSFELEIERDGRIEKAEIRPVSLLAESPPMTSSKPSAPDDSR